MRSFAVGTQGLLASEQGFGCMGMSIAYGPARDDESAATLHRAIALGVTMFDTAEVYGPFTNERLIGQVIRGLESPVTIATKFGTELDDNGRKLAPVNGRPEYVRKAAERSLRNLGTETIDLYYLHRPDPDTPIEETVGAMAELIEEGKVRYIGLSNPTAELIRRAHQTHPLTAVQSEYSLFTRDVETNGILGTVRELGIGFVAYSPIGRGFLSGTVRSLHNLVATDVRRILPRFEGDNLAANIAVLDRLESIARNLKVTPAQLALAWVQAQGDDIFPIPGTRHLAHLEENVAACTVALARTELDEIDSVAPPGVASGSTRIDPALLMKR
jgi:aryl-alcohol dehydrogenase-like predicted oxidoreductase